MPFQFLQSTLTLPYSDSICTLLSGEELTVSKEMFGLCPQLLGGDLDTGNVLPHRSVFVCLRALATGRSSKVICAGATGTCGISSCLWRGWTLKALIQPLEGAGHSRSAMQAAWDWVPIKTVDTKSGVSFPGWRYPLNAVTQWLGGIMLPVTPWGNDGWKLHVWKFPGLCPMCPFLWLILTCIISL